MLKIVTNGSAETVGVENTGSILKGKKANFIILDRNIRKEEEIKSTHINKTYFEGNLVYDYEEDEDRDALRYLLVNVFSRLCMNVKLHCVTRAKLNMLRTL